MSGLRSKDGIRLFRIAGIPVYLAYSWFIIAAFTVVVFGPVLQSSVPGLGGGAFVVAFSYAVLLLISVLIHELAHALSARAYGWPTEKIVLNLWGGHTQFNDFTATPGKSVVVAMSGPAANFILAALGWLVLVSLEPHGVAGILVNIFTWANFVIALFNVLPGLPLDGGRLVESLVWKITRSQEKGTLAAGWSGRAIVVALLVFFLLIPFSRGAQIQPGFGIVAVLVAGFLWMGASESIKVAKMRLRLPAIRASAYAHDAQGLSRSASAAEAASILARGAAAVVQGPTGAPEAIVDPAALAQVPAAALGTTPVAAITRPLEPGAWVPEHASGRELVDYLAQLEGTDYAVVDAAGRVTGILYQADLVAAITGKPALPRSAT